MKSIIIEIGDSEVIERGVGKFGTGAHVVVPKEYIGKRVKVVAGGVKEGVGSLEIDFENSEVIERGVGKFGTGAHVVVPKEYAGKKVKVIVLDKKGGVR